MLSLQEITDKTKQNMRQIEDTMDARGLFHPELKTAENGRCTIYHGLNPLEEQEIRETLHSIPLHEFLAKMTVSGGTYLIPDKVHDDLIFYTRQTDACPLMGHVVTGWQGGDLLVDIVNDGTYKAHEFDSGGQVPSETAETTQATLSPKSFGVFANIASDLIEDSQFGLVEWHLQKAAMACGDLATSLALTVLISPPDGWGTLNESATGDADETKFTLGSASDIITATRALGEDRWVTDTIITTPEAWGHSIAVQALPIGWTAFPPAEGYTNKLGNIDVLQLTNPELHASTDLEGAAFTNCITLVISRQNAMLTGRKRWLQINDYADPVKGLAGATLTCRQDSVTLYKDAVYKLTET